MRNLSRTEIEALEKNGCRCDDWSRVYVSEGFIPDRYRNVTFSGNVRLGTALTTTVIPGTDIPAATGIYDARIHDCTIGNEVLIERLGQGISHCDIADNAIIANTSLLSTGCKPGTPCRFGEGTAGNVLDETGSRCVRIFRELSAQAACIISTCDENLRHRLNLMVERHAEKSADTRMAIGPGAMITDCGEITGVRIGAKSRLKGVARLSNGTIDSSNEAPTEVGPGVIASDFIIAEGATVTNATQLTRCYVGQAAILRNFTAHDSLIFANCCLCNGEAASILAGPYTVSDHKSTLLIGGMFTMFNAGSGTNQSNHLYKLGPIHHGSMGRGSKCASDSYIMWPAKIGDFTMVSGRHYGHPDTTAFPFSYLVTDSDGASRLIPGVALNSCGTARDIAKWPRRDNRMYAFRHDTITFDALNPYNITKMGIGLKILKELATTDTDGDYLYNGMRISRKSLLKGIDLYTSAIIRYLGETMASFLEHGGDTLPAPVLRDEEWIDLCGFVTPKNMVDEIVDMVMDGQISTPGEFAQKIRELHTSTPKAAEKFALSMIQDFTAGDMSSPAIHLFLERWVEETRRHADSIIADACKEAGLAGKPIPDNNHPFIAETRQIVTNIENRYRSL